MRASAMGRRASRRDPSARAYYRSMSHTSASGERPLYAEQAWRRSCSGGQAAESTKRMLDGRQAPLRAPRVSQQTNPSGSSASIPASLPVGHPNSRPRDRRGRTRCRPDLAPAPRASGMHARHEAWPNLTAERPMGRELNSGAQHVVSSRFSYTVDHSVKSKQ